MESQDVAGLLGPRESPWSLFRPSLITGGALSAVRAQCNYLGV